MATILNNEILTYNPSSLVNIFNNALTIEATKKAFRIRGIYLPGKGVNYNGLYYDSLKEESSDACSNTTSPHTTANNRVYWLFNEEGAGECGKNRTTC